MLTRLPHKLVAQSETRTNFEGGAYTTSWTTDSIVWGNIQIDKKNETYAQDKKQQMTYYKIVTRADFTINNTKRFLHNDDIYVIESVGDPTMRGRMKSIYCRLENE